MEFYEGQKVKITANTCRHSIEIGKTVVLEVAKKCSDGSWNLFHDGWVFDEDDCEPIKDTE
jgi:hypothetical protein